MSYITSAERIGREQGRAEGLLTGIAAILDIRFGAAGVALMDRIDPISDVSTLEQLLQVAKTAHTLDEVRALAIPSAVEDDSADNPSPKLN